MTDPTLMDDVCAILHSAGHQVIRDQTGRARRRTISDIHESWVVTARGGTATTILDLHERNDGFTYHVTIYVRHRDCIVASRSAAGEICDKIEAELVRQAIA